MSSKGFDGKVAAVSERDYGDYICLSVQPEHGTNEANLFVNRGDNRTTWELHIDRVQSVRFDVLGMDEPDESVKFTFVDKHGAYTDLYIDCTLNALLTAIEAERMAIEATSSERKLP